VITSYQNPLIKRIKRLKYKKYRQREGAHFAEGIRIVISAIESGVQVEVVVFAPELLTSDTALRMIEEQRGLGTRCEALSSELFVAISERDNPVGLGAIVSSHWTSINDFFVRPSNFYVALFDVAEPGNLGTVLRTADASGSCGLLLIGNCVDPYHPTALKASMGAVYSVPFAAVNDDDTLLKWATENDLTLYGTTAKGIIPYWQTKFTFPAVLLMGSERQGLSDDILKRSREVITIPMRGEASSLNLAVATGIVLFELARQNQGK
jgi:TrmH family RNA methyltransferase